MEKERTDEMEVAEEKIKKRKEKEKDTQAENKVN